MATVKGKSRGKHRQHEMTWVHKSMQGRLYDITEEMTPQQFTIYTGPREAANKNDSRLGQVGNALYILPVDDQKQGS